MLAETLSIVSGSMACNGRCPFCIAGMTQQLGIDMKEPEVNWRNFRKACIYAKMSGVTTAMITSKGEPTLFPNQITKFLKKMLEFEFPLIELQTNAIKFAEDPIEYEEYLRKWYELGMTTIAISIVHYNREKNRQVYLPYKKEYFNLEHVIQYLHDLGFTVRLTCIGAKGFIDSPEELEKLIEFAKANKVEQLTFTPVNKPEDILDDKIWHWTNEHHLSNEQLDSIIDLLEKKGSHFRTLSHGAHVYDFNGQNICLNYCLTVQPDNKELRNIIFFPDGHARSQWQFPGSIIF